MAADDELKKLEKLPPEERAKKYKEFLKKLDEESKAKKQEIEKAKKDVESVSELTEKAKRAFHQAEDEEIQKAIEENISIQRRVARELESRIAPKVSDELEQVVAQEISNLPNLKTEDEVLANLYTLSSKSPLDNMYANAMSIYNQIKDTGEVSPQLAQQAGLIDYFLDKKKDEAREGIYTMSEELAIKANLTQQLADSILSVYTGGVKRRKDVF